ncbi:MAG: hypothetical protein P8X89_05715 [Reinekea sp.]
MKAKVLLDALLAQPNLPHKEIQAVYDHLPEGTNLNEFRAKLIDRNIMSYRDVMNIFVQKALVPKSKTILIRLDKQRKENIHFKPKKHQQKYCIHEDDKMSNELEIISGGLTVSIPAPDITSLRFTNSDEKQAIMLALELVSMDDLQEVEVVLLETLESFGSSKATAEVLAWFYLSTGHSKESEARAKAAIESGLNDQEIIELLALAEQRLNKHLLAVAMYQKLLQLERVKSLWYLLMAYSQERSNCPAEAAENYQIYITIGKQPEFKQLAKLRLQELRA